MRVFSAMRTASAMLLAVLPDLMMLHLLPLANAEISVEGRVYNLTGDWVPQIVDPRNPGRLIDAYGDVYNRTKCYCRRPQIATAETHWYGAYFHITYFNWHTKRLYSLEWICKTNDIDDDYGDTECHPMQDQANDMRGGYHMYKGCVYAGLKDSHPKPDRWCYAAMREYAHRDASWFNDQLRKLEYRGRSRYKFQPEVNAECHRICKEKVEPSMVVNYYWQNANSPIAGNVIDTYEVVDDMCDKCR